MIVEPLKRSLCLKSMILPYILLTVHILAFCISAVPEQRTFTAQRHEKLSFRLRHEIFIGSTNAGAQLLPNFQDNDRLLIRHTTEEDRRYAISRFAWSTNAERTADELGQRFNTQFDITDMEPEVQALFASFSSTGKDMSLNIGVKESGGSIALDGYVEDKRNWIHIRPEDAFLAASDPLTPTTAPNIDDKDTVVALAVMTSNAYTTPDRKDWMDLGNWRFNISYGWSSANDEAGTARPAEGLKSHVFVSEDDSLLVISFKGTTPFRNNYDRLNDNYMFSCCCARSGPLWNPVCECYVPSSPFSRKSQCSQQCLQDSLEDYRHSYYQQARQIYNQVRALYPNTTVWFTGHSLGGAIASLMGLTVGAPAIAYQAPGERMFASRLGFDLALQRALASLPGDHIYRRGNLYSYRLPLYHFGNTADPIFNGKCNGPFSTCYYGGYAMETRCHLGNQCVYEVDRSTDISYHRIGTVIKDVLLKSPSVPECKPVWYRLPDAKKLTREEIELECSDCNSWKFV